MLISSLLAQNPSVYFPTEKGTNPPKKLAQVLPRHGPRMTNYGEITAQTQPRQATKVEHKKPNLKSLFELRFSRAPTTRTPHLS